MTAGFGNAVALSGSRETRWLTPPYLVEDLGKFDLDPCGAPGHELADRTYLLENNEDGLILPWHGRIWLNPPYGKEAEPFLKKMVDYKNEGGGGTVLIFARTETIAFHKYVWAEATAMKFIKGRIRFWRSDLTQGESANAPSVLVAYGEKDAEALQESTVKGAFIRLSNPLGITGKSNG